MGKIIVVVVIAFLAYAWYKGWVGEWIGQAADSGSAAVKQTQKDARKTREQEEKK